MNKRMITALVISLFLALGLGMGLSAANGAAGDAGSSPDNPIIVGSLSEIPAGAALTAVVNDDCSTTTTGVLTVPATDSTSHQEFRYSRVVPGTQEQSHMEYKYQRSVVDYKTQYHFRKFTHTKTKAPSVPEVWANFSPDRQQGPFTGPPTWPNDSRGTWHVHNQIPPGQDGPDGVYSTSDNQGRASWFYRQHAVETEWSDYGPWTPWVPETHESWQDSNTPLGQPEYHGSGTYQDGTKWYREWQAQWDGQTRQVENGSHLETTDWVTEMPEGDGWEQIDSRKVVDKAATDPYTEYFVLGGEPSLNEEDASWVLPDQVPADQGWVQFDERTVTDTEGTPEVVTYYSFNDGKTCPLVETPKPKPAPPAAPSTPVKHFAPNVPTVIDAGL